jgi:S1-C subfamily serine protease
VIVEFDGQQVKNANDLPLMIARAPVKKTVKLKLLREKHEVALNLTIAELKEAPPTARREELG